MEKLSIWITVCNQPTGFLQIIISLKPRCKVRIFVNEDSGKISNKHVLRPNCIYIYKDITDINNDKKFYDESQTRCITHGNLLFSTIHG